MQEALRAAIAACPRVKVVGSAGDGLSALNLLRAQQPALLVIDSNLLEDETLTLLRETKREQPLLRCLVFTQTRRQRDQALAVAADAVLPRHSPANSLNKVLEQLFSE